MMNEGSEGNNLLKVRHKKKVLINCLKDLQVRLNYSLTSMI